MIIDARPYFKNKNKDTLWGWAMTYSAMSQTIGVEEANIFATHTIPEQLWPQVYNIVRGTFNESRTT